ncbi:hypothetical protein [Clostridium gasigenes]|uniref:Uncharacterized protein n=1 Tax=Clostridium gasigenes TaxID=94869 RepID=A0A7X0SC15_9CLOT|nr:hypothetical protein [Clostridium gasigenes]MBB6714789.1 hypothetical protein [Clostridium gasigenes]
MIRVDNYNPIGFIRYIDRNTENNLDESIKKYLLKNSEGWNLNLFIKLYQDYLLNTAFCNTEQEYVLKLYEFCKGDRSLEYVEIESIDKRPVLQPLLQNFIRYLDYKKIYKILNRKFLDIAHTTYNSERGIVGWFEECTKKFSGEIVDAFTIFMNNFINIEDKYNFEIWIKNRKSKKNKERESIESFYTNNRKIYLKKIAKEYVSDDKCYSCNYMTS